MPNRNVLKTQALQCLQPFLCLAPHARAHTRRTLGNLANIAAPGRVPGGEDR